MSPPEPPSPTTALLPADIAAGVDPQLDAFVARQNPGLHSRDSWARQQVLDHITQTFQASMGPLNEREQRTWLGLFHSLNATGNALDTESRRLLDEFEQNGLRELRKWLKQISRLDLDPQTTYLHTAYALDPQTPGSLPSIFKRALDTSSVTVVEVATLSLWDAARLNFAFFDFPEVKGRWISHDQGAESVSKYGLLEVDDFIRIVRELNLGADLRQRVEKALAPDAGLSRAISAHMHDLFRFNLYDAPRNANNSGLSRELFDALRDALELGLPWLKVEHVSLKLPDSLPGRIAEVEFTIEEAILQLFSSSPSDHGRFHLPLLIIRVPGVVGLYSYCAERPGGVLRHHVSQATFEHEFKALLQVDNARGQLGWLISSLSFEQQGRLWPLLDPEHKPEGLNWAAGKLYDAFHWVFPVRTLDDLEFAYQPTGQDPQQALSTFYSWRFRVNVEAMAVSKGQQDWRAVKEGVITFMHHLLDLLLTPVPGGLGSIGRIVTAALGMNLVMELYEGIEQAGQGHPESLLQAGLEIGSLLLMGGLHGYAGRLASRHIASEFAQLDRYRMVPGGSTVTRLWKDSLIPYARKRLELASVFDGDGLGRQGGKLYGQARENDQELTVELQYDKILPGYRAVPADPAAFHPPMAYDPESRRWSVSLDDSRTLSDTRLLERMVALKGGTPEQLRRVLETSGVSREHLDQVWSGQLPQPALVEALERFEVEQGIAGIVAADEEQGLLSPMSQRVLFCLLPHLSLWPEDLCLRVHDSNGELQQVYGRRQRLGMFSRSVKIRQLAQGGFVEHSGVSGAAMTTLAHEAGVLDLILGLLPGETLIGGMEPVVRRVLVGEVRLQLGVMARERSAELFEALGMYSGWLKIDAGTSTHASSSGAIGYLPVFLGGIPHSVVTLRLLYPHLSLPRLAQFLRDNPLSSTQVGELLDARRVPYRLRYSLDREQQFSVLGRVLDGIRQVRSFHESTDAWLQCIADDFLHDRLGRGLRWVEGDSAALPVADRLSLRRYGQGAYSTLQARHQPNVDLSVPSQSFYLALAASLSTREQGLLGMSSPQDIQSLRDGIFAYLLTLRREDGSLGLRLEQYARPLPVNPLAVAAVPGLYTLDRRWLVRLGEDFHEVEWDGLFGEWRGRHPTAMGAYGPLLEHNGRGGWWHEFEQPLAWSAERALRRLLGDGPELSESLVRQVLGTSGVPDSLPGRLLFENQVPVPLLDEVSRHFGLARPPARAEASSELAPLVSVVREQFPSLSEELAQAMLEQAESSECRLIRESRRLPLGLAEEARYLSGEIDVCRLYESLCLPTERTDVNDTLLLQLLEHLPGWEPSLRIELRRDTAAGPLIARVGVDTAMTRRILVKSDAGYESFAMERDGARSLATVHEDPFSAVLLALPQLRRTTLGIAHLGETVEQDLKRVMFQRAASDRNQLRRLLGQSPVMPWAHLPQRLVRLVGGTLGYPLTGRARASGYPPGLLRKLRGLYRGCSDAQLFSILADLGRTTEERTRAVEGLQAEYRRLRKELAAWVAAPLLYEPESFSVDSRVVPRREIARRIRRCWRRQSTGAQSPLSYVLVLDGLEVEDLPELNADFSHVTLLSMNNMGLEGVRYLSRFLRSFTGLTTLRMERSGLSSLPNGISQLQKLQVLSLENNRVRLIRGTARELEGLTQLLELNLNGNPLAVLPDFASLQRLRVLRLSHTGIHEWPPGLLGLRDLVRVELRMNTISDLPVQLFNGNDQLCHGTDLSGNPLSSQALSAILNYRQRHEQQVNFGIEDLPVSSTFGIDRWAVGGEKTPHRIALWRQLRDLPGADVFFLLFERMSSPPTFFSVHYQGARNDLSARVWRVLEVASQSLSLCNRLFQIEGHWRYSGSTSYQIFNRLEFAVNCHEALKLEPQAAESRLLTLLRGQFRLEAMRLASTVRHTSPLFWYRAYYDALARDLALPDQFNGLFSTSPVRLSPRQIEEMKAQVLSQELAVQSPQSPVTDPSRMLLSEVLEELPEEVAPEPPEVLPEYLPQEDAMPVEDGSSALVRFLVSNDVWSNFLIHAHDADFQRVFGKLLAYDSHPEDNEYRLLWRTRMSQFQYNTRRSVWVRYWTIRALLKEGVSALGSA
ncbi:C-terminal E3 ligase, LRR-interacting [Pseudomonas asplenii]|uniref:RING-type E3 ubiquitin transferase n=1 Tax=Pseudomonas asplenii TaxID=53407 RepID=A0A0M9GK83_9PSED|nr:NEL-type E3 ubiquitin ligase domain-containing protein [Pseudomonas fuscovaginae]KPA93356.1 C-terminal E3 ligase, LRR-interacting [Pseudomonas fuscovaginae]